MSSAVIGAGFKGARRSMARAADMSSMARICTRLSTTLRNLRPACQPIETWSSCMAELGMESTLAGTASRLLSETSPAWVYWAIISPESTPASSARNGGRPCDLFLSSMRSVRRSDIEPRSVAGMARKSRT